MSWIQTLFTGNAGEQIAKPIDAIGNTIDKIFTSDDEKLGRKEALQRLEQELPNLTAELDKLNATSSVPLVQFARPFCVYVAGVNFSVLGVAVMWFDKGSTIPMWYIDASTTAFLGALGLYGVMRSVEKVTGKIK